MLKISFPYQSILIFLLALLLGACDSSDQIPIQKVDSRDRLTDAELTHLPHQQSQALKSNSYLFGFDLRSSPHEDAAQYLPFLKYLESATGYHFKLHFTPKNSTTIDEIGEGLIQFAAMGSFGYLKAQSKYPVIMLVQGVNRENKTQYRSAFIVSPLSPIQNIKEIKGKNMAFGNRNSTQGYLIPQITLKKNGIALADLKSYDFTGSHQRCAEVVIAGKFDVCGMQDTLAEILADQGLLRIIHFSDYFPSSGIVANKSLPTEVVQRVQQALLDFGPEGEHRKLLYHWGRTEMPKGFVISKESDFIELRQWTKRFGLLPDASSQGQLK